MNISTKITGFAAAGLLAASLATSVSAETVNFSDYADANGEGFVTDVAPGGVIALNGNVDMEFSEEAWLDGSNALGNAAGLGQCSERPVQGCSNSSFDDVDPGEVGFIDFVMTGTSGFGEGGNVFVTITDLLFRSDFHLLFNGVVGLSTDTGDTFTDYTVVDGVLSGLNLVTMNLDYQLVSGVGASDQGGFYIEAITAQVPLPAGLLLLGTALGGLGLARRRNKAA